MFEGLESSVVKEFYFKFTSVKNSKTTVTARGTGAVKESVSVWAYVTRKKIRGFFRLKPCFSDR